MSSGGRSAEQQAVAEHNLEGQHQALLQELRDECGKDCKRPHRHTFNFAPPCVDPAMDENLTRNAQLSVLDLSPCRFEQHQPVEFGFRVQSLFEPTHGQYFNTSLGCMDVQHPPFPTADPRSPHDRHSQLEAHGITRQTIQTRAFPAGVAFFSF